MSRTLARIGVLAILLGFLAAVPAFSQSPTAPEQSPYGLTNFPATGDTMALQLAPLWRAEGDYVEGWRTFEDLPEMNRVMYDLVAINGLLNGGRCNFVFRVNNQRVGSFFVDQGEPTTFLHADFAFEPIPGPTYKFLIELETGLDPIEGAIAIPLDTSILQVFGFPECPAETALNRADDGGRLALLRRFRNELLGTDPSMRARLDAYYAHAAEATTILASHPLLLARTASLLRRSMPALEALLDGEGQKLAVPARDLRAAYHLLDDLSEQASPQFASALLELRGMLRQFEERNLAEAWRLITSP